MDLWNLTGEQKRVLNALEAYDALCEIAHSKGMKPGDLYVVAALIVLRVTVDPSQFRSVCDGIADLASKFRSVLSED